MANQFAYYLYDEMLKNEKIFVISADIGYNVLDKIVKKFPKRFINIGTAENTLIGIAIGLSYQGYIPICYTISTFLLYRPFELIRNYVNNEKINIKLIGAGRDKDYLPHNISHWSTDDEIIVRNAFPFIHFYKPDILTKELVHNIIYDINPCYLNISKPISKGEGDCIYQNVPCYK